MHLTTLRSALRLPVLLLLFAADAINNPLTAQVAAAAQQVRRIAGCYDTHMGSWSGPLPATGWPAAHTPPAHFQLDSLPVNAGSQSWLAVRPVSLVDVKRLPAMWSLRGTDSIIVVWSTGFVGVTLHLAVHQDSLIGRATTFHDAQIIGEPPDPSAPIIATRRACPLPRSAPSTETAPIPSRAFRGGHRHR